MKQTLLSLILMISTSGVAAQQIIVLPAVSDNVPGQNGSIWSTELLIVKTDRSNEITVKRLWVCVPDGGFAENPGDELSWSMTGTGDDSVMLQLFGEDLLDGSGSALGAVGLQVDGGVIVANAKIVDISNGTVWGGTPLGQGQRIPTGGESITGASFIPWIGGCLNVPCANGQDPRWDYLRSNIGIVNPNPTPLSIAGDFRAFGNNVSPDVGQYQTGIPLELAVWEGGAIGPPESIEITLPAYGWTQSAWRSSATYVGGFWFENRIPNIGFIVELTPESDTAPYFAYASVVFAPDPSDGAMEFNDPMFVPAEAHQSESAKSKSNASR